MGHPVVAAAEKPQVGGFGRAAVGPMDEVVGVAPAGGNIAARVGAALVPLVEGAAQGG